MKDSQQEILHFWFVETDPSLWFQKNEAFDAQLRERFLLNYEMARDGLCDSWMQDADGCLALCVLLDQFPRNMFRGQPESFATDDKAILVARHAITKGFDQLLSPQKRRFVYLPFEHSEKGAHQRRSLELFALIREDDPIGYDRALRHYRIIEKFGRFPHRNKILGRDNTPEEEEFLAHPPTEF